MAWTRISPDRLAVLLGELPTGVPAYQALAARVRRLAAEGRLARDTQLPSERALAVALGVSRTTVTRAYDALVETGYAAARQGSGTVVDIPGSALGALGGLLTARSAVDGVIDLTCAAPAAVPDTHAALGWAVDQMPAQVRGSGYYPEGLPALREAIAARYCERGLATSADEVVVTTGALAGLAIVSRLLVTPGDRVLTESPSYPNAMETLRSAHGRIIGHSVDSSGWDVPALETTLRRATPRLALLMPDFHNPTGAVMSETDRERVARALARTGTTAVIDESSAELLLDPGAGPLPRPFAAYQAGGRANVVTVGSASKLLWGGLRIGWIRAPRRLVPALVEARVTMDLGSSVLEQLAVTYLFERLSPALAARQEGLRRSRDTLVALLAEHLPTWSVPVPSGGLNLWCRLPGGYSSALAEAGARAGLLLVPGGRFSVDGGLEAQQRLPFTLDAPVYVEAVRRLVSADAEAQRTGRVPRTRDDSRPLIA
jgi:DNA-binding transcriptional MocR family regulator